VRKQSWEQGHIDYMGRDSFDNIWKKICETLSVAPQREPTPPQEVIYHNELEDHRYVLIVKITRDQHTTVNKQLDAKKIPPMIKPDSE